MSKMTPSSAHADIHRIKHFRARLMSQLMVVFICITVLGQRLATIFTGPSNGTPFKNTLKLTLAFLFVLSFIVIAKYILYRRFRTRIFKYSNVIDIIFCLVFTADWMVLLDGQLHQSYVNGEYTYSVAALVGFSSIAWRVLLQILITQYWQVRVLPIICVYSYFLWFAVTNQPEYTFLTLFKGISIVLFIILIFYFEHKVNFMMTMGNMQQQQWLQLNEFILNNIPENIAIMDLNGNCSFISESFRKLMRLHTGSNEIKQLLQNVKNIQQQKSHDSDSETADSVIVNNFFSINSNILKEGIPIIRVLSDSKDNADEDENVEFPLASSLDGLVTTFGNLAAKNSVKEKSVYVFNGKFKRANEPRERSIQINMSFIKHPNPFILLIFRDTTERDLVLTLEGNIKYKDHLLASVSHELRTPLNGNINLLEAAIKSKDICEKVKESFLVPAMRSSKFLLHLINDILDMSQIKAQKLRLIFQHSSLRQTFTNTIQLLELHARKKGIHLDLNLDSNIPDDFCTDHARLSQIILNLMNNSIKFTQNGHITLSAISCRDTNNVKISVEDTGIGMTEEEVNKLFKEFTHIECKDRERLNPSGIGLGLKIAKDLALLLGPGGNKGIIVESSIGKGSKFSFILENKETGLSIQEKRTSKKNYREDPSPLIPNEFHTDAEYSFRINNPKTNNMKSLMSLNKTGNLTLLTLQSCSCADILVVDDDLFNIMAYEVILNSLSVKYECVYSGRSAIDKMLNKVRYPCSSYCRPYKIVFMDEEMPGMSGTDTVKEITSLQERNLLPSMKIIGCTAHDEGEEIEKFLKSGIVEIISKPVSGSIIKKVLERYNVF